MSTTELHRSRSGSGRNDSAVGLVARLLETPHLPAVVRSLDAETLHRLVRTCGLEDCGEIVALATPQQLQVVFDLDVWRPDARRREDRLDVGRFGTWLEVLVDAGVDTAARTVMALDSSLLTTAVMTHVLLVQPNWMPPRAVERLLASGPYVEIGSTTIVARRSDAWDALVALLEHLNNAHPDFFHELMSQCWDVSIREAVFEDDDCDVPRPAAQLVADASFDRDLRRDAQGYVTPAEAAAFLVDACRIVLHGTDAPGRDIVTSNYFRDLERERNRAGVQAERHDAVEVCTSVESYDVDRARALFFDTLRAAGVVTDAHRPLLSDGGGDQPRYPRLRAALQAFDDRGAHAHAPRQQELAYLANVLAAGCSFDSRRLNAAEAFNAAAAACNLGLENWPRHWPPASDLTTVFRVGWSMLHEQVVMRVPRRLIAIMMELEFAEAEMRDDIRAMCDRLGRELAAGKPWRARDHLDTIASLETPSWAILVRLIDECPAVPRDCLAAAEAPRPALRHSTEFDFISENRHITWALAFVESLPSRLMS